jgi:two-component system OmpR family sensor kinase
VADARIVAPGRDVSLEQTGPVVVSGDESRLRQVVTNLVVNALRHAGDEAHVEVRTSVADGGAVLEVSDDGAGMTSEIAGRVFEPFYRSGEARSRGEGAAGLGLSIVAAIAAAHGGDVELQTAPGQGARFRVRLPLAPPPDEGAARPGDGAQEPATAAQTDKAPER